MNLDQELHVEEGTPSAPETPPGPEGWHLPLPEKLPRSTYWPATLAFAVTIMLMGLLTSFVFSVVGLLLTIVALAGWVREMRA